MESASSGSNATSIPPGITREDVEKAIREFEAGAEHGFGPSTFYDLLYEDQRYPPKAILGLAARRLADRVLRPDEFIGGEKSQCFSVLRSLGLVIVPKEERGDDGRRYWVISLGEGGQYFDDCRDTGIIGIEWNFLGDLGLYKDREAVAEALREQRTSDSSPVNNALCNWQFANELSVGDIVFAKVGQAKLLAAAEVQSGYLYDANQPVFHSIRQVKWLSTRPLDLPKRSRVPIKTLTEVTTYWTLREIAAEVYPEIDDSEAISHGQPDGNLDTNSLFSSKTFELLEGLHLTPTLDFYQAHKDDFASHVQKPFRDLLLSVVPHLSSAVSTTLETK